MYFNFSMLINLNFYPKTKSQNSPVKMKTPAYMEGALSLVYKQFLDDL